MFKKLVSNESRQKLIVYGAAAMMPVLAGCLQAIPVFSGVVLVFSYEGADVDFSMNAINGPESMTCRTGSESVAMTKGGTTDGTTTFTGTFTSGQLVAGRNAVNCTVTGGGNTTTADIGSIYVVNAANLAEIAGDVNLLATNDLTITLPDTGTATVDERAMVYGSFNLPDVTYSLGGGTLPTGLSIDGTTGNVTGSVSAGDATGGFPNIGIKATTTVGEVDLDTFTITVN